MRRPMGLSKEGLRAKGGEEEGARTFFPLETSCLSKWEWFNHFNHFHFLSFRFFVIDNSSSYWNATDEGAFAPKALDCLINVKKSNPDSQILVDIRRNSRAETHSDWSGGCCPMMTFSGICGIRSWAMKYCGLLPDTYFQTWLSSRWL